MLFRSPLSAAGNAGELENRSLDDPRLRSFVLASLAGESNAHDAAAWDLTRLTLAAVYYHPDLDIARARLALARARVITAGQRPNPTLNFAAVFQTAAVSGAVAPAAIPLTIGPVINLIVETFDKREYRVGEASHLSEAARWDLATAGWRVRAGVRDALLALWAARQRTALTRQRLALQEELVRLLERRLEVGEASALEVSRERMSRAQVAVELRGAERAGDLAAAQLAAAVGVPARAMAGVRLAFDGFAHEGRPAADAPGGEIGRASCRERV